MKSSNQNNQDITNNSFSLEESQNLTANTGKEVRKMQDLMSFSFENQELRTAVVNNEPYFCLKDVCDILEIGNSRDVVTRLDVAGVDSIDIGVKTGIKKDGSDAIQQIPVTFVNESNLYRVVFRSDKQEAKKFQSWIFNEVLPAIRKTGRYSTGSENVFAVNGKLEKQLFIQKAMLLQQEIIGDLEIENSNLKDKILEDKPKVENYDILLAAKNSMTMNEVAKAIGWGRNNLFDFLRKRKILMENNSPYQKYMDAKYFTLRLITIEHENYVESKPQTLVTLKGIEYILSLINSVKQLTEA